MARGVRKDARPYQHTILDIKTPVARTINAASAKRLISSAAKAGGLKVIEVSSHTFGSNAFTAFALLSQSHVAIHTWPEFEYVACDIFSCGGEMKPVVDFLLKAFSPAVVYDRFLPRGIPSKGRMKTIFVDETGPDIRTMLDVRIIDARRSDYQDIQVLGHRKFGKMLVINGDVQFAESDHDVYDEALLAPLAKIPDCRNILIVGGGDGLCCTYLLKRNIKSRIDVLELDPTVVEVCLRQFGALSNGLKDSRVHLIYGDAVRSISGLESRAYDAVVIDTTAPDTKWGLGTYSIGFLGECKRVLKDGGILSMNGSSIWYDYDVSASKIQENIQNVFGEAIMATALIPSFGSPWAFFTARNQ